MDNDDLNDELKPMNSSMLDASNAAALEKKKAVADLEAEIFGGDDLDLSDLDDEAPGLEEEFEPKSAALNKPAKKRSQVEAGDFQEEPEESEDDGGRDLDYHPSSKASTERRLAKKRIFVVGVGIFLILCIGVGEWIEKVVREAKQDAVVKKPRKKVSKLYDRPSRRDSEDEKEEQEGEGDRRDSRSEAIRGFEQAVDSLKSKRRKVDDYDEAAADEVIIKMISKMRQAANDDLLANENQQPATAKLKLLPRVLLLLQKSYLHEQILEHETLDAIRVWLEPMPDGSLPSINIRRSFLEVLARMPIATDHLRESKLGRVVMFMYKCPKELAELRKKAGALINQWSRPILGRNASALSPIDIVPAAIPEPARQPEADGMDRVGAIKNTSRVRIPQPVRSGFQYAPKSNVHVEDYKEKEAGPFSTITKQIAKAKASRSGTGGDRRLNRMGAQGK